MKKSLLLGFLSCCALGVAAAEVGFTYNSSGEAPYEYGFKKPQTYDIGVALNSSTLVGKQLLGFSVPVFNSDKVKDVKAWLSAELTTSKLDSKFVPDIASYDVTVADGVIDFSFPEAFTIPENGVYVGYSLTVDEATSPVAVVDGNAAGGLWLHAETSQKKWADYAGRNNIVSPMTVTVAGDFPANAAEFSILTEHTYAEKGKPTSVVVKLVNWGSSGISSFDYKYSVAGMEKTGSCQLETPVGAVLGYGTTVEIDIDAVDALGDYTIDFSITSVNGSANEIENASASCPLSVLPFVAVYRPLVEEYTGRACGWCPRGYVMLEQMNLYYGDQFVALAYHNYNHDGMTCTQTIPFSASGAPACAINRNSGIDPDKIPAMWEKSKDNVSIADVVSNLEWADDSKTVLKATAKVRFVNDIPESSYSFSIALLADSLYNETWGQSNAYADYEMSDDYNSPYWDLFIGKDNPVYGLEYNDVVVYYDEDEMTQGIKGSLPEAIEAGTWYEYIYEIPVENVKTVSGEDVVNDFNKTRAVAIVLDSKSGKPLNCASSIYPDGTVPQPLPTAVRTVEAEADVVSSMFFNLQGQPVANPDRGLYIKVECLSDGSFRSSKIRR